MIRATVFFALALALLSGCASLEAIESTPAPSGTATPESSTPTSSPAATATLKPTDTPTPTPMPTAASTTTPTPSPSPTPAPEPVSRTVTVTPCCGLFDWLDDERLLVFDQVPDSREGAWSVPIESGDRQFVSPGFGVVSQSGVIAFPDPGQGRLVLRDSAGEATGAIANGGRIGWPSPDGSRVAWFENLPIKTPSSSVNRSVELHIGDVGSGETWEALELQAAEVHWLPDNRHLLIPARNLAFEQAGLWLVDSETGDYEVLYEELFIQAVRLSPGGGQVAFMRTFNDDPAQNGVWVLEIQTGELVSLGRGAPFRWDADGEHLWTLEMSSTGAGVDRLRRVEIVSGDVAGEITLEGQVRNDTWAISPDGRYVAYWRVGDGQVVVESLETDG